MPRPRSEILHRLLEHPKAQKLRWNKIEGPITLAKVVLILVNIGFIVAGSLLIWLGSKSRDGHWSDIFSTGTATDVSTVSAVVMALGASVILIALFGLTGAACRNRCLLTLYSIFVVVGLIIFVAIAVL
ncbi:hypothetical protein DYB30_009316, partial [Aphanomyces astaci]